jgi:hypothetical protein
MEGSKLKSQGARMEKKETYQVRKYIKKNGSWVSQFQKRVLQI